MHTSGIYLKKKKPLWKNLLPGKKNVGHEQCVNLTKIEPGLIEKNMAKENERFHHLKQMFLRITNGEINQVIFVRPQIRYVINDWSNSRARGNWFLSILRCPWEFSWQPQSTKPHSVSWQISDIIYNHMYVVDHDNVISASLNIHFLYLHFLYNSVLYCSQQ